jgi:hypothetical protein
MVQASGVTGEKPYWDNQSWQTKIAHRQVICTNQTMYIYDTWKSFAGNLSWTILSIINYLGIPREWQTPTQIQTILTH